MNHGSGSYLYDTNGNKYLDLIAGIAVSSVGHSHPNLVSAITNQTRKLVHTSNLYAHEPGLKLAAKLLELAQSNGKVFFSQDGATANEAALKIVRKYGYSVSPSKNVLIAFENSFHGRTMGALAVTGNPAKRDPFAPFAFEVRFVPVGDFEQLEMAFDSDVAGVIVEPIQGEGGMIVPPENWLAEIRRLANENSALMIADEVQSGIGRAGEWFLSLAAGVRPDLITLAKGLAGGMPLGAVIVEPHVAQVLQPGDHGTTFGGNPVSAAAALSVVEIIETENLMENSRSLGGWLHAELSTLGLPYLSSIRGAGLWLGLEFEKPIANRLTELAFSNGFLINAVKPNVIRIAPPLNISKEELQDFLNVLPKLMREVESE